MNPSNAPRILTTTVGSYPVPDWLAALPSEQALLDATRVVFDLQRQAGIDLPTDGELYRFDVDHPDTNGMIEYFVHKFGGVRREVGRCDTAAFRAKTEMRWRNKPAAVVTGPITEGFLNLPEDCARAASVAGGPFKFTLTSPYMLARTLLDEHYHDFARLTLAIADALAAQMNDLNCACVQVDEANVPGNPADGPLAAEAINHVLDAVRVEKAVHFCFGNYGGQTIQKGDWTALIGIGLGVVDIKVNHVETPEEIARAIERAEKVLGPDRVRYVHPDCGFWMLKRSIADRKIAALAKGRDLYLARR